MIEIQVEEHDNDARVDVEIAACLNLQSPVSFFLFAGAGSGKTRSLVDALRYILVNNNKKLRLKGQRVGVITYTNKACDEIKQRVGFDPLIEVSTIHSFFWKLIEGFDRDIKAWVKSNLENEIANLQNELQKARPGTKTRLDREKSIESKRERLIKLSTIKIFKYSPTGDNKGYDYLNHNEVIAIAATFLNTKAAMQLILTKKFPILLIDESQDTNKMLMESLLSVQKIFSASFVLGLFGDTMQRIYADGKPDLGRPAPVGWATPAKKMNYRCPSRVVKLINKIREEVDDHLQKSREDAPDGTVRLFIFDSNVTNKSETEHEAASKMAVISGDVKWKNLSSVKVLILEHRMAAYRMNFIEMFEPLYQNESLRIGLLDGTLSGLKLFTERVFPLIEAKIRGDEFGVASIVRKHSPLLSKESLKNTKNQIGQIGIAKEAVERLWCLFEEGSKPRFIDILRVIYSTGLFEIPDGIKPIALRSEDQQNIAEADILLRKSEKTDKTILDSWDEFLITPFEQVHNYIQYTSGNAHFDTHQGVKGLEFSRVMVIIDDHAARGFGFSYDKLFGLKEKTKQDLKNEMEGKETGIDRTRRLLYVTCSRAEESLAIVAYADNPHLLKELVIKRGWFNDSEVIIN